MNTDNVIRRNSSDVIANIIVSGVEKQFERLNNIKDPVLRYSFFLEIIRTIITTFISVADSNLEDDLARNHDDLANLPENTNPKDINILKRGISSMEKSQGSLANLKQYISKYFDGFADWIAQPIYSPDHPLGKQMMDDSSTSFSRSATNATTTNATTTNATTTNATTTTNS